MCALYGFLDYGRKIPIKVLQKLLQSLANASEIRGTHATGIAYNKNGVMTIYKRPKPAHKLHFKLPSGTNAVMGHTRFTTQGSEKCNFNNHPFRGHAGTDFALAHNGVLYNDKQLRTTENLPFTPIETDSFIMVQLLEKYGSLNFANLRKAAELVSGGFTFTLLDTHNSLYFIKGESPLYLIHFPTLGLYVYASTSEIMNQALEIFNFPPYEVINVEEGELVKITADGQIFRDHFTVKDVYLPCWSRFYPKPRKSIVTTSDPDEELEDLLDLCGYFGMSEEDVFYMLECGYSYDEIEEFFWNPGLYEQEVLCEEM